MKQHHNRKLVRTALLIGFLGYLLFFMLTSIHRQQQYNVLKEDLVALSHIEYGLFNVDNWRDLLVDLLAKRIEEFELSAQNKSLLHQKITAFLYEEVQHFEDRYKENNSWFRSLGAELFGVFNELKKQIPYITETIIEFADQAENKEMLKEYILKKLEEYSEDTFSTVDYSQRNALIQKYLIFDNEDLQHYLSRQLNEMEQALNNLKYQLFGLSLLFVFLLFAPWFQTASKTDFIIFTLIGTLFLLLGIYLPMMEIDARISSFSFNLFGEALQFENQILYYNSRSILGVVKVLFQEKAVDMIFVGILLFCFSVLFPFSKLISSLLLIISPRFEQYKLIQFLVYKTAKWSMADVMVIAIFMAYIGFSGIINSQLQQIKGAVRQAEIFTTNHSELQLGFYAFTIYVLLSLLLTTKLKKLHNSGNME